MYFYKIINIPDTEINNQSFSTPTPGQLSLPLIYHGQYFSTDDTQPIKRVPVGQMNGQSTALFSISTYHMGC